VLVVDDEDDVGQTISDMLELHGHTVEVAASGQAALEKTKRRTYDVILSDIRMQGMDGPSFYRALRDSDPNQIAGLAFITGDTLSPRVKEFLDASKRPYLEKPLMPKDVRDLVDLLMRGRSS
jgi:CheY-like chemotaxis protein